MTGSCLRPRAFCDGLSRSVSATVQGFRVAVCPAHREVRILQSVQAVDAGTVLNPVQLRGQVEGGVAQALGAALFEEVRIAADGVVTTRRAAGVPRARAGRPAADRGAVRLVHP